MSSTWTRIRRYVVSLMLAAMASFVVHGGVMAAGHLHGAGAMECAESASPGHGHRIAASRTLPGPAGIHDHAGAVHHASLHEDSHTHGHHGHGGAETFASATHDAAALDAGEAPSGDDPLHGSTSPCCASACAVALSSLGPDAVVAPRVAAVVRLGESQRGFGTEPEGLKRPPRTPCTA